MAVLDGSIFVTMPEESTAAPPVAATDEPPSYGASSSVSELQARLARAAGNAEVQQLLQAYLSHPYSQALSSQEVVDILLKFATNDAEKVSV